jgi:hypothetical protein
MPAMASTHVKVGAVNKPVIVYATKKRMTKNHKPFSAQMYGADDNAKHDVIGWLEGRGFTAWVNPDQYGIDVLALYEGNLLSFEVEVKHNWVGEKFPFDAVHFSARKLKFATPNSYFTMLNNERSHVLVTTGIIVSASPVVSKQTKYTASERFIEVPLARCVISRLPARLI